jgi:hypothetical protein
MERKKVMKKQRRSKKGIGGTRGTFIAISGV